MATMEQLLESGSSGLQAVAQQLGFSYSGGSTFMTSTDNFLKEIGRGMALGDMNYLKNQAKHYDTVADHFSQLANNFSAKDFATSRIAFHRT